MGAGTVTRKRIGGKEMPEIVDCKYRAVWLKNGISTKIPNRRISVEKYDGGYIIELLVADKRPTEPHASCGCIRGKVASTNIALKDDTAKVLVASLAELMGFALIKKCEQ